MAENIRLLPIMNTISDAWQKTYGVKKTIWAAIGVMLLLLITVSICLAIFAIILSDNTPRAESPSLKNILGFILHLIGFLFQMGLLLLGVKRAADLPINYRMAFSTFKLTPAVKLIGYYLLQFIILFLIFIPFVLITILLNVLTSDLSKDFLSGLILTGSALVALYIFVRLYLTPGFILDKDVNPWEAIKLSFISTRSNFLRLLIIAILQIFIVFISMMPFGLGLIWSMPFTIICYGVIYQTLKLNAYPEIVTSHKTI